MTTTKIDISIDEIDINNYDGLYLIGGPLALNYLDNKKVHSLIKSFHDNTNKPYGAICISPRILVNAGVMNGVKMTGWNDDGDLQGICEEAESIYIEESVVKDGRVITADGPMSAYEFGKTIGSQIFYS